jgi:hypothetical protein
MKRVTQLSYGLTIGITVFLLAGSFPALAADLMVYPAEGQPPEQQTADQQECKSWAINQSGVNPDTLGAAPVAVTEPAGAKPLRGAAVGAAVGGLGGSLGGEFGKGAAAGAAVGILAGGIRQRRERKSADSMNQQLQQQQQQHLEKYTRAYGACLEGKGYTVK